MDFSWYWRWDGGYFLQQRIYFMQQQKLLSLIRQAIEDYNMIEEGDKIAVGVSGELVKKFG